jgi:hypothetical protein
MDTGADCSVLMPADARRLNINYSDLHQSRLSTGIGGHGQEFIAPASLIVSDENLPMDSNLPLEFAGQWTNWRKRLHCSGWISSSTGGLSVMAPTACFKFISRRGTTNAHPAIASCPDFHAGLSS